MVDPFGRTDTTTYRTEDNSGTEHVANIFLTSIENFLKDKSNFTDVEKTGMDYILNEYRNIKDRENLCKVLSKQHLEKESQLVENEYSILCQKGFEVAEQDIGPLFLYELIIFILHSYGKRSFQDTFGKSAPNTTKHYLSVAYILSNTITPGHIDLFERHDETLVRPNRFQLIIDLFLYVWTRISYLFTRNLEHWNFHLNSLSTILIERSLLKLRRKALTDEDVNVSTIIRDIDICKERLKETKHYLEFGVFKVDTKLLILI